MTDAIRELINEGWASMQKVRAHEYDDPKYPDGEWWETKFIPDDRLARVCEVLLAALKSFLSLEDWDEYSQSYIPALCTEDAEEALKKATAIAKGED